MKTSLIDFILCGLVISLLVLEAAGVVWLVNACGLLDTVAHYRVVIDIVLFLATYGLLSALHVRLFIAIRPLQLGSFAMDHPNFTYWKLLVMVSDIGRFSLMPFSIKVMHPVIVSLFGGKVGGDVAISGIIEDPYLFSMGKESVIGQQAQICCSMTTKGQIFFGRVDIGKRVIIGMNSILLPDVVVGDDAVVGIGSVVMSGTRIGDGEMWRGNPARKWE